MPDESDQTVAEMPVAAVGRAAPSPVPAVVNQTVGWAPPTPQPSPPGPSVTFVQQGGPGPSMAVRAVWFLLIGWWLSGFAIGVAYVLCVTIVGLPFGFAIFNRLPAILTLRPRTEVRTTEVRDGVTYITGATIEQFPLWARGVYFILIGWWVGAIYLAVAWFFCVLIITLPIGLWLFNRVGAVMTLLRY